MITLKTDRLTIRDLTWDDLDFIHQLHSNDEVQRYATLGIPESLNDSEEYLSKYIAFQNHPFRSEYGFCISLHDQTPIGLIGLSNCQTKFRNAELWFKLDPLYWGQGFCNEASSQILHFAFSTLFLHRVEAGVATENLASIKLVEKIGMQREGMRRKILPIRGEWKDNFHYAILEEEFYS